MGNFFHSRPRARYDIINIGKISFHIPVVIHGDGLSLQDFISENKHGHVWSSPWAINCKIAKSRTIKSIEMGIRMGHELIGLLGGPIEGNGIICLIISAERNLGIGTVNGGAGSIYEPLYPIMTAKALEYL